MPVLQIFSSRKTFLFGVCATIYKTRVAVLKINFVFDLTFQHIKDNLTIADEKCGEKSIEK